MTPRKVPLLMSAPMVTATIREIQAPGTGKTQTRRELRRLRRFGQVTEFGRSDTPRYDWHFRDKGARWNDLRHAELLEALPWRVGDRLYIREHWRTMHWKDDGARPADLPADTAIIYMADEQPHRFAKSRGKARRAMHMPRWASRLTLEVTDIRVEPLQAITERDCIAEGIDRVSDSYGNGPAFRDYGLPDNTSDTAEWYRRPIDSYRSLWVKINGAASWVDRPWVIAITFRPELRNVDR